MARLLSVLMLLSFTKVCFSQECQDGACPWKVNTLLQTRAGASGKMANVVVEDAEQSSTSMTKQSRVRSHVQKFASAKGLTVQQDWSNPIPGHTRVGGPNLGMIRLANPGGKGGGKGSGKGSGGSSGESECETLKAEFLDMTKADVADGTADKEEKAEQKSIQDASAGKMDAGMVGNGSAFDAMEQVLSKHGVEEALKTDEIITEDDIRNIWKCEKGTDIVLDESEDKFEGDLMTKGDNETVMLAQFKSAIAAGSTWYGSIWNTNGQNGRLPFCYSSSVSAKVKAAMKETIDLFKKQIPCITFVEVQVSKEDTGKKQNGQSSWGACEETPSVIVRADNKAGDGCYSYVGMLDGLNGNSQLLNIGSGCETTGIVAHEFGHALGMGHEHSRSDRDAYITVNEAHILKTSGQKWVDQVSKDGNVDTGVPYDVLSLMHYGNNGGWIDVKPPNDFLTPFLGNRMGPTELDCDQFGKMYSCLAKVTPLQTNAQLTDHLHYKGCFNADNSKKTSSQMPANHGSCALGDCKKGAQWYKWSRTNCVQMCGLCKDAPSIAGGGQPAAPITPATTAAPITPATTAPPITPATTAAPITPATTAAPITPATTAVPITTATPASCQDSQTYKDPTFGDNCQGWKGFGCDYWDFSAELKSNCPATCKVC